MLLKAPIKITQEKIALLISYIYSLRFIKFFVAKVALRFFFCINLVAEVALRFNAKKLLIADVALRFNAKKQLIAKVALRFSQFKN